MTFFNTTSNTRTKTTNLASGVAYTQDEKEELATLVATSFLKNTFYQSKDEVFERVVHLANTLDPIFVAKAAIWGRHQMGMRTVSHVLAGVLAPRLSGMDVASRFYARAPRIAQDATEILSAYYAIQFKDGKKKKLSMSLKKGLKTFVETLDLYALQKYMQKGKAINMFDLINILHAKSVAIDAFKKADKAGELKKVTTEARISKAKTEGTTENEYNKMIAENEIGYMALIRNLNTMMKEDGINMDALIAKITDQSQILKSKIFPFQILTGLYYLLDRRHSYTSEVHKVIAALESALELSMPNAKPLEGKTLVALDTSGSMQGRALETASLFAAILNKVDVNADMMYFGSTAEYANTNRNDSLSTLAKNLQVDMGGTNFSSIFNIANKHYDRVIILTDNESWIGDTQAVFKQYQARYGMTRVFVVQFEAGRTSQFNTAQSITFAGYNDKVWQMISNAKGAKELVREIEDIEI